MESDQENLKCLRCNYLWKPRIENPRSCPTCKRYDWNKPKKEEVKQEETYYN